MALVALVPKVFKVHIYTESQAGMARVALVPNASTACQALQARSRALPENAFLQCTAQCLLQFSVNLQCTAYYKVLHCWCLPEAMPREPGHLPRERRGTTLGWKT